MFSLVIGKLEYTDYSEDAAHKSNRSLDGVLKGTRLIKTNENTYQFLADLQVAIGKTKGHKYAIIPDLACYWVKSKQLNPLIVDWVSAYDYFYGLRSRIIGDLECQRGKIIIIAQKGKVPRSHEESVPFSRGDYYEILRYVRDNFTKIDETRFFALYR